MRPFTVLIGIVLGSAASITFGLGAVLIVFWRPGRRTPRPGARNAAARWEPGCLCGFDRGQRREFPRPGKGASVARLGASGHRRVPGLPWFCCIGRAAAESTGVGDIMRIRASLGLFWRRSGVLLAACTDHAEGATALHRHRRNRVPGRMSGCWRPMSSRAASPARRGEEKTVAYLVEQFRKLGLKPGNRRELPAAGADGRDQRRRPTPRCRSAGMPAPPSSWPTARTW